MRSPCKSPIKTLMWKSGNYIKVKMSIKLMSNSCHSCVSDFVQLTATPQFFEYIMSIASLGHYPFRVADIFPGDTSDPVSCHLHTADWTDVPLFEAISYAWGDPNITESIMCDGKAINVTKNLHSALVHLRFPNKSRCVWADALW